MSKKTTIRDIETALEIKEENLLISLSESDGTHSLDFEEKRVVIVGLALQKPYSEIREEVNRIRVEKGRDTREDIRITYYKGKYGTLIEQIRYKFSSEIVKVARFADRAQRILSMNDIAESIIEEMPTIMKNHEVYSIEFKRAWEMALKTMAAIKDEMGIKTTAAPNLKNKSDNEIEEAEFTTEDEGDIEEYLKKRYGARLGVGSTEEIRPFDGRKCHFFVNGYCPLKVAGCEPVGCRTIIKRDYITDRNILKRHYVDMKMSIKEMLKEAGYLDEPDNEIIAIVREAVKSFGIKR